MNGCFEDIIKPVNEVFSKQELIYLVLMITHFQPYISFIFHCQFDAWFDISMC